MIIVRRAGSLDARAMADLLNAIIRKGGTTALTKPVTRDAISARLGQEQGRSAWHVAEDDSGTLLGFQFIAPHHALPPEACDIATFVRTGMTGLGIGSALFNASAIAATELGYLWINATIRADNAGGRAYYQSRGFEPYALQKGVALDDGTLVDKISTRFTLD
nr:GNAT family N-acetyltransferase [Roseobacter sp. AzwK-3b]